VQIEIVDQTALPVLARVYAYGGSKPIAILCGSPQESFPVDVGGATELLVHIVAGTCEDSTPSTPTTGVVRVTRV
jgi:hypothetical protein